MFKILKQPLWLVVVMTLQLALAAHFTGVYTLMGDNGLITLTIVHEVSGELVGTMGTSDISYELEGYGDPDGAYGYMYTPDGELGFEAYLDESDQMIGLYIYELTEDDEPIMETMQEVVFSRRSHQASLVPIEHAPEAPSHAPLSLFTPSTQTPVSQAPQNQASGQNNSPFPSAPPLNANSPTTTLGANPLAPANPLVPVNPLAAPSYDPWLGEFEGNNLTVMIEKAEEGYQGTIKLGEQSFPLKAQVDSDLLLGQFESAGALFDFEASLSDADETLELRTGGSSYFLLRKAVTPENPLLANPANPLSKTTSNPLNSQTQTNMPSTNSSPILAKGKYAELSEDNALAFIAAFEFSLAQAGYVYRFTKDERQQLLEALKQNFAQGKEEEQIIMSKMREIWTEAADQWQSASLEDQRAFILAILSLALGEETVNQLAGQGQGGGSASECVTFEDCTSAYLDDETRLDTMNAQNCWASSGCSSYDSSSNTFSYNEP